MNTTQRRTLVIADPLAPAAPDRMSRRDAMRMLSILGLTTIGAASLGARHLNASASPTPLQIDHTLHAGAMQEAGTPASGPALGEQADGTYVWRVQVAGMDMERGIDLQAFFPGELTINAGDAVYFELPAMPGFHTITFLSGEEPPALIVPETEGEAASPHAGEPRLMLNPAVLNPAGGDTYDGTGYFNSGIDVFRQPDAPPVVITFTEPGTYEYRCLPHGAVMRATIVVQEAGAERPEDQAAVDARAGAERAALLAEAEQLIAAFSEVASETNADGSTTFEVAAGAGAGQARLLQFLPQTLEINAGDMVRWINQSETEPHTVTFLGAGAEPPVDVTVEPQADGSIKVLQNPATLTPQGGPVFSGEGFVHSGLMGNIAPGGPSYGGSNPFELTFDTPGEYFYYCLLHASGPEGPGMFGKIIVR